MSNVSSDHLRLYFLTLNKTSQKSCPQSQKDSNPFYNKEYRAKNNEGG